MPGGGCAHENCSCAQASNVRDDLSYCSELCAQAEETEPEPTAITLCPCLHKTCKNSGEYEE
jgi:hypothetical protein